MVGPLRMATAWRCSDRMTPTSGRCLISCAGWFGMQSASSISTAPPIVTDGLCVVWTVEGRLVWREDGHGYDVVVDGRRLSWQEFGAVLEPFEGWTFRLSIRDIDAAR